MDSNPCHVRPWFLCGRNSVVFMYFLKWPNFEPAQMIGTSNFEENAKEIPVKNNIY